MFNISKGITTYIIKSELNVNQIDNKVLHWTEEHCFKKKLHNDELYFQIKDVVGRIIGTKRKCIQYNIKIEEGETVLEVRAWLGSYKRRTSLDGTYGFVVSDSLKHDLSYLFLEISSSDEIIHIDNKGNSSKIRIYDLSSNEFSIGIKCSLLSWIPGFASLILCPIFGWPGLVLLPVGFWLAIKGIFDREGKVFSFIILPVLILSTFLCVVRILANLGIYLYV